MGLVCNTEHWGTMENSVRRRLDRSLCSGLLGSAWGGGGGGFGLLWVCRTILLWDHCVRLRESL